MPTMLFHMPGRVLLAYQLSGFDLRLCNPIIASAQILVGPDRNLHHHFMIKETFRDLIIPTPSPLASLDAITLSHDAQCIFRLPSELPHNNCLPIFSSLSITPCGATKSERN